MRGAKIASLNAAVCESLNDIVEISRYNRVDKIKIAVLEFSNDINWMYPQLIDVEFFVWQDLDAGGVTNLGKAVNELNAKLSHSNGFKLIDALTPLIILLSDGEPTDEYNNALKKIKANPWFKVAIKVAIAIGNDANTDMLAEFTGNVDAVITVHTVDQLKTIIHNVSVIFPEHFLHERAMGTTEPSDLILSSLSLTICNGKTISDEVLGNSIISDCTDNWGDW